MLEVIDISKSFSGLAALQGVSFSVVPGEVVGVVGPNGSGKTTLLDIMTGLRKPDAGEVRINGRNVAGLGAVEVAKEGVVRTFQSARIFPGLTILENLLIAASAAEESLFSALLMRWKVKDRLYREKALRILEKLGLSDVRDKKAARLSLGQMRRVELGRVLMQAAGGYLLFDEPASSLDPGLVEIVVGLVSELKGRGKSIVLVEHNTEFVRRLADRVLVLNQGRKIAEGEPNEVFEDPGVIAAYLGAEVEHAA